MQRDAGVCETTRENDPLLFDERYEFFSGKGTLNLYRALGRRGDGIKGVLRRCRIDRGSARKVRRNLLKRYVTLDRAADALIERIEGYTGKRYSSLWKEKYRLKKKLCEEHITIEVLRVISLISSDSQADSIGFFNRILKDAKGICLNAKDYRLPTTVGSLGNDLAYLAGVVAGDGHIEKDFHEMKLVDGHRNMHLRGYSLMYLEEIDRIIRNSFSCMGVRERIEGNYFVFRYSSVLLCRFINHVYGVPVGKKSRKLKVPRILRGSDAERFFWRGLFDTDGSVREKGKSITFSTLSKGLVSDFSDFCERNGLKTLHSRYGERLTIVVTEESMLDFARIVGVSHPRKQKNLVAHLKRGATHKKPITKEKNPKLDRIIRYLSPYKECVYIRLTERREKPTGREISKRMKTIKSVTGERIVEVKTKRKNNHFYICSKKLVKEINDCYEFRKLWAPVDKGEAEELVRRWNAYE